MAEAAEMVVSLVEGQVLHIQDGDLLVFRRDAGAALTHGDDPRFRIALCGYEGEHAMPPGWAEYAWKTAGGARQPGQRSVAAASLVDLSAAAAAATQPSAVAAAIV